MVLEIAGATVSFFFLSLVFCCWGLMDVPKDILLACTGWLLLCWFSVGLGLVIGACSERSDLLDRMWHIVAYLAFPFSGAAFLVEWLPTRFQEYVVWVPTVNATEMIRKGFFGEDMVGTFSWSYLVFVNSLLSLFGLRLLAHLRG
jgi:capsular polysaccharide transport system permease protein